MNKILSLFLLLISIHGFTFKVRFGDAEKSSKRNRISILGEIDGNIYIYKYKLLPLGVEEHALFKYDPASLQIAIKQKIEIKRKNYEGMRIFNGKVLVFQQEQDSKSSTQSMYYDVYDANTLQLKKEKIEVAQLEYEKGLFKKKGSFRVITSEDDSKLCAYYDLPYKRGEPESFGFVVFDENADKMYGLETKLPQPDELMNLGGPHISDEGVFYTSATEVLEKGLFGRPKDVTHHIYKIDQNGDLKDYRIELPDKFIFDYTYNTNSSGDLICSGLYGNREKVSRGVDGGFYVRMDGTSGDIAESSFKDFPLEFITSGWSDRQKEKANKKKDKGKGNPTLYNYDIRKLVALDDGSAVLTAEQYYVRVVTTRDANGNTHTTYYYYYNDIIVMKLNEQGTFDWYAKIPKYQVSTNDGGYYSSYAFHVGNGKLYFMFNDNIKNYENGNATGGRTYATNFRSNKKNVTSMVEMDIADGKNKKVQLFTKAELGTIAVPKIHQSDREKNKLFIFGKKGRKERLGVIDF